MESDTTGTFVVQLLTDNTVLATQTINLVANTPSTFTFTGDTSNLSAVNLVFNGRILATDRGARWCGVPTVDPPTEEPGSIRYYLPMIASRP